MPGEEELGLKMGVGHDLKIIFFCGMQWIIILGDSQVGEKIIRNLRSPATRPRFCAVRKGGTIASVRVISGGGASRLIASSRRSARGRFRRSGPGFNCSPRSIVS